MKFDETLKAIEEAILSVGNEVYPKFNNIVIMAGGGGSGKGFVIQNLLGIEGKIFDTDKAKSLVLASRSLALRFEKDLGIKVSEIDISNPEHTSILHQFVKHAEINEKLQGYFANVFRDPERKPNVIFDITMKSLDDLIEVTEFAKICGYDPKNIHLVWVYNEVETAISQNKERKRSVPEEILKAAHINVKHTMESIFRDPDNRLQGLDGDIWLVPNRRNQDNVIRKSDLGGKYVENFNKVKIKEKGKKTKTWKSIAEMLRQHKVF